MRRLIGILIILFGSFNVLCQDKYVGSGAVVCSNDYFYGSDRSFEIDYSHTLKYREYKNSKHHGWGNMTVRFWV